jgi:tetratricopeptide (TPR) repeat protein
MGTVFMAEQTQPVQRKVALKVIKPGMDSRQVIARFEAERQALAVMDHVNIARVFDGGATAGGRPYFVMELVHGVPITKYCDDNHLTPRERLELFVPVCQAIQHAHQKGIIHRDIKPSNVLVTLYDGKPVPKVIDFGVAKAAGQSLTEKTLVTGFGAVVGTLEYMSPEQAEVNQLDVDTRSDVYSLGVLLYELLTGTTPFTKKELGQAGMVEMLRVIREREPTKPSTKLSTAEGLPALAANRGTEPAKLTKMVRGELDWIVMKCLEKDRNRRYETASAFAADLQRYLADEPVRACPPSAGYRLRKLVRRNRGPVLAVGFILLCLVAGIIGTTWGLVWAVRERGAKERARADADASATKALAAAAAEKEATKAARAKEAETQAVLDFVLDRIIASARPQGQEGGLGREVTLRKALEASLPFLDKSFPQQPLVEARLRATVGFSFLDLNEPGVGVEQYEKARTLYTTHLGRDHPETIKSMGNLASMYHQLGRYADALKLREETLALAKAKLGPDHPNALRSANNLANSYAFLGRHGDALKLREETLALMKAKFGPDAPETLTGMMNLANSHAALGRHTDALKLHEEVLALRRAKLAADHPETLHGMYNLAKTYAALGRHTDALKLHEETLARQKVKLGPDHWHTLSTMDRVAAGYAKFGRDAEAVHLREESLSRRRAKFGADHSDTLVSMSALALSYAGAGRHAEALRLHEESLALRKAMLGPDHPDTLSGMNNFAWFLATAAELEFRDPPRAVALAARAAELMPQEASFWTTLGTARYRAGAWKAAAADLERAIARRTAEDPANAADGFFLAMARWELGEREEARAWFAKAVRWMEAGLAENEELKRFRAEAAGLLGMKTD